MKNKIAFPSLIAALLLMTLAVWAHDPVKLSGYLVDTACAADHVKDSAEAATKFAAEHTKSCGLMEECVKSGYGVFSDGKWYPFDDKGNQLAKAILDKTQRTDHIKITVEGMKHDGKILVQKMTAE
ncbi:MAG: hypothetical protein HYR56_14870 [Acidobacteria bacterium]|nr:hypothetical protein [Acidobacteriota bacterium]MBI3422067.1 hypothetical protein [Acidobacteriota bacterium]